jgi:hypothetical protein
LAGDDYADACLRQSGPSMYAIIHTHAESTPCVVFMLPVIVVGGFEVNNLQDH